MLGNYEIKSADLGVPTLFTFNVNRINFLLYKNHQSVLLWIVYIIQF
jgi:hypothetical protein